MISPWRLMVLGLAIALGGCHQGAISQEASFNPAAGSGTGLVVIGMRVSREPQGHNWIFGNSYELNPVYSIEIGAIGADGRLARPTRELGLCDAGRLILNGVFSSCDPAAMRYQVIEVPAGQYALWNFTYRARRIVGITSYIGPDPTKPPPDPHTIELGRRPFPGDVTPRPDRSFTVNAGDIVTIGEMTFDATSVPARLSMTRNDQAAQAALRSMPRVSGQVVFRPVFGP